MDSSNPRQLAIRAAIFSAALLLIVGLLVLFMDNHNFFVALVIACIVVFVGIYLIVYNAFNRFIFEKLRPIYKTIHSTNFSERKLRQNVMEKDINNDVKKDVVAWAKKKTQEITQLRQLEKYRREFLGNVSHELKTPIFNIQGYVLTLLDGGINDPNINLKYLERADRSVNRMIAIVNDLETISKLEAGELKLKPKSFNIIKLFEESIEEHEMLAAERNIAVKFKRNYERGIHVWADQKRISHVVNNLVVNSIKYGKKGGTTIISFDDLGNKIQIEVEDDGIGIDKKDLPRIFERFFRTDKSRSREMGGTGLGLSIVKHIIEGHNQTISVTSKPNVGSSFIFTLSKASK